MSDNNANTLENETSMLTNLLSTAELFYRINDNGIREYFIEYILNNNDGLTITSHDLKLPSDQNSAHELTVFIGLDESGSAASSPVENTIQIGEMELVGNGTIEIYYESDNPFGTERSTGTTKTTVSTSSATEKV